MKSHESLRLIVLLLTISICPFVNGEETEEIVRIQTPNVAEYMKFGTYQMDYSTGVPNIEIPIYSIKLGNFTLPISLRYHASGIKVQETPSCVGLGWMLSAGGCISVDVKGIRDNEHPLYASSKSSFNNLIDTYLDAARDIIDMGSDSERDSYHYSFPGHSGTFRYSQPDDSIRTIPFDPIKIDSIGSKQYFKGYKITDAEGNRFYFEKSEQVIQFNGNGYENCAWHLTKIEPAQSSSAIIINYLESQTNTIQTLNWLFESGRKYWKGLFDTKYLPMLISSIEWEDNKVEFKYYHKYHTEGNCQDHRLSSIIVKNSLGNIVNSCEFYTTEKENPNFVHSKRVFLDSLKVNGDKYSFEYNQMLLPNYTYNYDNKCYEDFWGYYNGDGEYEWFPAEFREQVDYLNYNMNSKFAKRTPKEDFCKASSLTKIIYPTGGFTTFDFESNYVTEGAIWGGLRLKSYCSFQSDNTLSLQKFYRYFDAVTPDYVLNIMDLNSLVNKDLYYFDNSEPYNIFKLFRGSPILPLTEGSAPIHYLKVEEYDGTVEDYSRKVVYEFDRFYPEIGYEDQSEMSPFLWSTTYNHDRGIPIYQLVRKSIFQNKSNKESLVYEEVNSYTEQVKAVYNAGIRISKRHNYVLPNGAEMPKEWINTVFFISSVYIAPVINNLSKKTIKQDGIILTEEYEYDRLLRTNHPLIKKTTRSDGKEQRIVYTFPFQDNRYSEMSKANIQIPIKEVVYVNNNRVSTKETTFKKVNSMWLPYSISIGLNNDPEQRTTISYNSSGRITCIAKDKTSYTNYVYGYNGTLPVMEIIADKPLQIQDINVSLSQLSNRLSVLRNTYENQGYLVNTYRYEPLIGVNWMEDSNRSVRTFQYDNRGRLISTKDYQGNKEMSVEYYNKE